VALACARPRPQEGAGYWSVSCVSGDGRYLLAGGDHAALVDLSTDRIAERRPGMVEAVGCDATGGLVVGYGAAFRWPGGAAVRPVPRLAGDGVVARGSDGSWISTARTVTGGRWRGPATVFATGDGVARRFDLLPAQFGSVGAARPLPTPDTFAVRFGSLLDDGRLLLAAGWQPSRSGGLVEGVPWGFFALDLVSGDVAPLSPPLASDPGINQSLVQEIAASADGAHLAVAAHDGRKVTVGRFARGAGQASAVTRLEALGAPHALAVSADGAFLALGIETRGSETPARAVVIDGAGRTVWQGDFRTNVAGAHFLPGGALVIAGDGRVVRPPLRSATLD
jgi:hypothetical protein